MSSQLAVFTPSLVEPALLEQTFVARHRLLADAVSRVRAAATGGPFSHTLLVGPRGSGKTHLLTLVHYRTSQMLAAGEIRAQVAWLPEDPWAVTSYDSLLASIAESIEADGRHEEGDWEASERALTASIATSGPVILLTENFDTILDAVGPIGQQRLRHLAQSGALLIVATTTLLSRDLSDQDRPFYGFLTTTRLQPFTPAEAADMLARIAEVRGDDQLARYLGTDGAHRRLAAAAHLAGGQPRIWAVLADSLTSGSLDELGRALITRLDDVTPYYQEQLARLSPQQRLIVVRLAELDRPMSVRDLSEVTRVDQRTLSKALLDLKDRGWVAEVDSFLTRRLDRRRTYYELAEPLARLAVQIKSGHHRRLSLTVDFIRSWFDRVDNPGLGRAVTDHAVARVAAAAGSRSGEIGHSAEDSAAHRESPAFLLADVDDALDGLVRGDPEPMLTLSTTIRTAVEPRLDPRDDESLATSVAAARRVVHQAALVQRESVSVDESDAWLARARNLHAATRDATDLTYVAGWLAHAGRFDDAADIQMAMEPLVDVHHPDTVVADSDSAPVTNSEAPSRGRTGPTKRMRSGLV